MTRRTGTGGRPGPHRTRRQVRVRWAAPLVALALALGGPGLLGHAGAAPDPICGTGTPGSGATPGTATCTYTLTNGEQTFTVPTWVSSVHVVAIGAPGGGSGGGSGDQVSADLPVGAGQPFAAGATLYVEVGGPGGLPGGTVGGAGGFNGGASGGSSALGSISGSGGGGGGGASDVRTISNAAPNTLASRLLVAGGGGGGGGQGTATGTGIAGLARGGAGGGGTGGNSATPSAGGTGGNSATPSAGGTGGDASIVDPQDSTVIASDFGGGGGAGGISGGAGSTSGGGASASGSAAAVCDIANAGSGTSGTGGSGSDSCAITLDTDSNDVAGGGGGGGGLAIRRGGQFWIGLSEQL